MSASNVHKLSSSDDNGDAWDSSLRLSLTYKVGYSAFTFKKSHSPKLGAMQELLMLFIFVPAVDFFADSALLQLKAFDSVKEESKSGWQHDAITS
jgi:hypothetical protein